MRLSGNRPVLYPVHQLRDVDPAKVLETGKTTLSVGLSVDSGLPDRDANTNGSSQDSLSQQENVIEDPFTFRGKRTGRVFYRLAMVTRTRGNEKFNGFMGESRDKVADFLAERVLKPNSIRPPWELTHPLTGWQWIAEIVYHLRPLIYGITFLIE